MNMSHSHGPSDSTSGVPEPRELLLSSGLCKGATDRAIRKILEGCHLAQAQRGETLWTAGTEARFFLIVADGLVRLARRAPLAQEVVVELVGPYACAGILAALSAGPYPLTATAVTRVSYVKIPTALWRSLMREEPQLHANALQELRSRLIQSYDFLGGMASCSIERRIASALLAVRSVLSSPFSSCADSLPISRQCLAEIAATTVESAIRTTTKWQHNGWIETGYRSLKILDLEAIQALLSIS